MPPKKKPIEKLKESVELDLEQQLRITGKAHKIAVDILREQRQQPIIIEEPDVETANQLALSGEFCQPRFSEHRNCYILIRRKK